MKILYGKKVIEISAKEAREAEIYGSPACMALIDARSHFDGYEVKVKGKTHNVQIKGLTRDFMKAYIQNHPVEGKDLLTEFNTLCGLENDGNKKSFAAVASYGELRMWFLNEYPELTESRNQINEILENTRKELAAKRAA